MGTRSALTATMPMSWPGCAVVTVMRTRSWCVVMALWHYAPLPCWGRVRTRRT